ncbi:hypothetical protein CDAR_125921 [Caerostris darwini]|uniref:Ubiquitin-like protease family profile domain-containing protein n=1 Tax=Caerostris darwini TaxID=1538125 RepID=A0AAV4SXE3_9ARAC|nr:hypothetical protein CDAR_125921 [Caerostris darwini]
MNGNQIHFILSRDSTTSPFFKGVYASDKNTFHKRKKYAFVVNSDESSEPGSHWLAFYCENGCIEFFDSFGNPPDFYDPRFHEITLRYPTVCWNSTPLQNLTSNVCGMYCTYFILKRCQGNSLYSIVNNLVHCKTNDF